jgi:hypothetical protein
VTDQKPVTSVSQWKQKSPLKPIPLELPSGNTCLVRPVGMDAFLKQGLIPNSLLGIVSKALAAGEAGKAGDLDMGEFMSEALQDPEKLRSIFDVADAATVYCVLEPRVEPIPEEDPAGGVAVRDPEKLYVDEIDLDDKLFIFNFAVGGTRDLEAFRQATTSGVGSMALSDLVQLPTEQPPDVGG